MHPPRCAASRCQPQRLCRTVFTISRRLRFGSLRYLPISAVVSADSPAARLTAVLIVVQLELPSPRMGGTLALPPSTASCGGIFNPKGPFGNAGMAFATLMKSSQCHKCNQRTAVPSRSALCSWSGEHLEGTKKPVQPHPTQHVGTLWGQWLPFIGFSPNACV